MTRKFSKRTVAASLADADKIRAQGVRRGRLRRGLWVTVAILVVCGLVLGGLYLRKPPMEARPAPLPTAQRPAATVFIDGWSLQTLSDVQLFASVDGGAVFPLQFEPVIGEALAEVAQRTPRIAQVALARQLVGEPSLECDDVGCAAEGAPVDVTLLELKGEDPAVAFLTNLGISTGLWQARVPVPDGAAELAISGKGWGAVTLPLLTAQSVAVLEDGETAPYTEESLLTGFLRYEYLISAGLGQLFIPEPAWLDGGSDRGVLPVTNGETTTETILEALAANPVETVAVEGLGQALKVAQGWTDSQLTLATSPTKGCSAGIVCYPGVLESVVQEVEPVTRYLVSNEDGELGAVQFDDRTVNLTLPSPIKQAGIEGVLSGAVTLRLVTVSLFEGDTQVLPVDWAGLVAVDDDAPYSVEDALANVVLRNLQWELGAETKGTP